MSLLPQPAVLGGDGYVAFGDEWWLASGQVFYSPDAAHTSAEELARARVHFFAPGRFRDPFGHTTTITYDGYDLLPRQVSDAVGNVVSAGVRDPDGTVAPGGLDYRVLWPRVICDANRNVSSVAFDALGLVVAAAVAGKPEEKLVDRLDDLDPDLPETAVVAHFVDPLAAPHAILGRATSRLLYDFFSYYRTRSDPHPQPAAVHLLRREVHDAALAAGELSPLQHLLTYSDGFGREIQAKAVAEPGPLLPDGPPVGPRWVGTGWTVFNNKGKPVRQYEPFFSDTHRFKFAPQVGVSPVFCYDPLDRLVATLMPDDGYTKVVADAWRELTWDAADTVLLDPRTDEDVSGLLGPHLAAQTPGWQTWHARRTGGALGAREQAAAAKAAGHAATPAQVYADSLGRTILTVAHNRRVGPGGEIVDELYPTQYVLDIEGAQRQVVDARGVVVLTQTYDVAGRVIGTSSPDAGERWMATDVRGAPTRVWDARGHDIRHTYDADRRPTEVWLRRPGAVAEILVGLALYGEARPDAEQWNLRGRVHLTFDGAGLVTASRHDFKGNLLASRRQLATSHDPTPDWTSLAGLSMSAAAAAADSLLEIETFTAATDFDALDRPVLGTLPDTTVLRFGYNEAGLLERVAGRLPGDTADTDFVVGVSYDAKGRRARIDYGNGTTTRYTYDERTSRLRRLVTWHGDDVLQDHSYSHDPVGNISDVIDAAQPTLFFAGQVVAPATDYRYDAIYRLVAATGREHASLGVQPDRREPTRAPLPHPNDSNAVRNYAQTYDYDAAGNILAMAHQAGAGSWTRTYTYAPDSNQLLLHSIPGSPGTVAFGYDDHGNMTSMPHLSPIAWNHVDQMSGVDLAGGGVARYSYDGTGRRLRKLIDRIGGLVEEWIYLDGYEVYRRYVNGTPSFERTTVHVMDDQQRVALVETNTLPTTPVAPVGPRIRYQIVNHLGSSCLEVDHAGAIVSYEEYHPYGTTSLWLADGAAEVSAKRYRYTSKEKDEETGLYYQGARYYACWLGRWTAPDPAGLNDGPNRYAYVRCDPVRRVDPSGTESVIIGMQRDARQYPQAKRAAIRKENPAFAAQANALAERMRKSGRFDGHVRYATPTSGAQILAELKAASRDGPIKNLVIYGHSGDMALYPTTEQGLYRDAPDVAAMKEAAKEKAKKDKKEYKEPTEARHVWQIREMMNAGEIKFAKDAVIILVGCKAAGKEQAQVGTIAQELTKATGVRVIAAVGATDQFLATQAKLPAGQLAATGGWVETSKQPKDDKGNDPGEQFHWLDIRRRPSRDSQGKATTIVPLDPYEHLVPSDDAPADPTVPPEPRRIYINPKKGDPTTYPPNTGRRPCLVDCRR